MTMSLDAPFFFWSAKPTHDDDSHQAWLSHSQALSAMRPSRTFSLQVSWRVDAFAIKEHATRSARHWCPTVYGVERTRELTKRGAIAYWTLASVGESEVRRVCKQLNQLSTLFGQGVASNERGRSPNGTHALIPGSAKKGWAVCDDMQQPVILLHERGGSTR